MSTFKGRKGEDKAANYLKRRGYSIIGRNVRRGKGELDIIARRADMIIFVEVKAHKTLEAGLLAVHADKCERLKSAANAWLGSHPELSGLQCRFDLIILTPRRALGSIHFAHIEHLQDVIR
ncbi:MAG: YraN family protein [Mariprofundaceae bacterium]